MEIFKVEHYFFKATFHPIASVDAGSKRLNAPPKPRAWRFLNLTAY